MFFSDPNDESEKIRPIELPTVPYEAGQKCVVSGFGMTNPVNSTINHYLQRFKSLLFQALPDAQPEGFTVTWLKYTYLTITSFYKCDQVFLKYHVSLNNGNLCAWAQGTDACSVRYIIFILFGGLY